MSWYKSGTVAVENGSATITGTGTAWIANVKPGQAFRLQGAAQSYEIISVNSNTSMTVTPAYLGSTASAQNYTIEPVAGPLLKAIDALSGAIDQFDTYANTALAGRFGDGSAAEPGIAFSDDINTGFRRPNNDQIAAVTGGVDRTLLSNSAYQVDVPITGTAVQSSATDTTAGRLMPVGAFGLGASNGVSSPNNDANDCVVPGLNYRFSTSGVNSPLNNPYGSTLHVFAGTGGNRLQQIFVHTNGKRLYLRRSSDGGTTWTSWVEIFTQASIVGTVSQSGGVPTGAIIESDSNANGEYVRFADGTQICTNGNSAITTNPAAFSGTVTNIDGSKLRIGRWF